MKSHCLYLGRDSGCPHIPQMYAIFEKVAASIKELSENSLSMVGVLRKCFSMVVFELRLES